MYHQETCCFLVTFVIEKTCKHKMMNEKKKTRKARRTKADIEKAINEAARSTIMEKGFAQTTILDIIKKAKIEPATFYKRYKNLENVILLVFILLYTNKIAVIAPCKRNRIETKSVF